ncbi:tetratricopeptide repeat protein [Allorhodopirellula solitaria]|nr:tetratricopeptide repeat protein [Allorhodopirellula solitaria]
MSAQTQTKKTIQPSDCSATTARHDNRAATPLNPAIQRAWKLIKQDNYLGAANVLITAGRDPQVRNTLGVCFMRAGRAESAAELYRGFVLMQGSLRERPNICNAYKRNFATALFMNGLPSGALSVLRDTREPSHPRAIQLYAAIKDWEKSLPWFQRLDWILNGVEPANSSISLQFEPGEFDFD